MLYSARLTPNAKREHMNIYSYRLFQSPELGVALFLIPRAGMSLRKQHHINGPLAARSRSPMGLGKSENSGEGCPGLSKALS